jgi:hypothetical protein
MQLSSRSRKLVAMVTDPNSIPRSLAAISELANVPARSPSRGPPYCKSVVLRSKALGGDEVEQQSDGSGRQREAQAQVCQAPEHQPKQCSPTRPIPNLDRSKTPVRRPKRSNGAPLDRG